MSPAQAFLLGLIQGLTEFLPISSSGHLVLLEQFFGFSTPPIAFDSLLHLATLAAVIVYFRSSITLLFTNLPHFFLATLPSVIFGFLIYRFGLFLFADMKLLGWGFLVTSLLLFFLDRIRRTGRPLTSLKLPSALFIGLFQALSILPSISRSGATIAAARFVGLNKSAAFTFSFLMRIPAILGALTLTIPELVNGRYSFFPSLIGFATAFITGFLSLKLLDLLFTRKDLRLFTLYTFILGLIVLGLIA